MKKISVFLLTSILFAACHSDTATSTLDAPVPTVAPEIGPAEDVATTAPVVVAPKDSLIDTAKNNAKPIVATQDTVRKPAQAIKQEAKDAATVVKAEANKLAKKSTILAQDAANTSKQVALKAAQKAKQIQQKPKK